MSRIDAVLEEARQQFERVRPEQLFSEIAAGGVAIDIRPERYRLEEGAIPGALVIERNVLEWRLDPTSPSRIPEAVSDDRRYIIVCNEGYASSLAAADLHRIGLFRATDLIGGFRAWKAVSAVAASAERTDDAVRRRGAGDFSRTGWAGSSRRRR